MKKSLIALAILGTFASAASAQTSLSVYGIVDAGLVYDRGGPGGSVTKLSSGVQSGSRLGFRGTEDLGGGLSAKFVLEAGFDLDTGTLGQGGLLFGRQAYAGLGSNQWGDITFGRQYTPHVITLDQIDPFNRGLAGNAANLMTTAVRMNDTIKYSTPSWGGFTGELAYGFGEVPDDTTANRQVGAAISYSRGPLLVRLGHHSAENATGTDDAQNTLLGAKFDFGMAAASAGIGFNKGLGTIDSRDYLLGVSMPFGPGAFLASYIRKDDRSLANSDADQWGLGYIHAISRRTNFYTSFARISNDAGAAFTVGNASEPGVGDKSFNVGIRHKF